MYDLHVGGGGSQVNKFDQVHVVGEGREVPHMIEGTMKVIITPPTEQTDTIETLPSHKLQM